MSVVVFGWVNSWWISQVAMFVASQAIVRMRPMSPIRL